jgi:integrase/recombinase XerD
VVGVKQYFEGLTEGCGGGNFHYGGENGKRHRESSRGFWTVSLPAPVRELVTLARRHRLTYAMFHDTVRRARLALDLHPSTNRKTLPKLLSDASLESYFTAVAKSGNVQHEILLKLLFYTSVRVSELCAIRTADVDLQANTIRIEQGKGSKDRYVVFPRDFRLVLDAHIRTHPDQEYLFESSHRRPYSRRRIHQIVVEYGEVAGIPEKIHPHTFRHQMLTWLTRQGLTDSQIQLISGHESKKSLEVYQHMALSDVKGDYQEAVRKVGV